MGKYKQVSGEKWTGEAEEEGRERERSASRVKLMDNLDHMSIGVAVTPQPSLASALHTSAETRPYNYRKLREDGKKTLQSLPQVMIDIRGKVIP